MRSLTASPLVFYLAFDTFDESERIECGATKSRWYSGIHGSSPTAG